MSGKQAYDAAQAIGGTGQMTYGVSVNVSRNTSQSTSITNSSEAAGSGVVGANNVNIVATGGDKACNSGGVSLGYTTKTDGNPSWSPKEGQASAPPAGGAGVGRYSGNEQASVTKSGISGTAGDQSVRTGDTSSAGTLVKDWNTQTIVKDVQAQAQLTQEFGQKAAREIGTYADKKYNELRASDPTEAAKWAEGGEYRVALHAGAGALGGGIGGALGAGASAALMPRIGEAIAQMGLATPVEQALGAISAAAIGGMAGGAAGAASAYSVDINNRQLHFTEAQKLSMLKAGKTPEEQYRLDAAACALVRCADGIPPSDPAYARLRSLQQEGAKYTVEQNVLKATGEFVYSGVGDRVRDALTRNDELTTRLGGASDLAGGSVGMVGGGVIVTGGAASCAETLGLGCAAVPLGLYIANAANTQAQDGSKTLFGSYQSSEGQRVLDSFNVAGYPGERDPLMDIGVDASKFGLAWLGGKYVPKALATAEGVNPSLGVPVTAAPLPPPRVRVTDRGVTEIIPTATPLARQGELNIPDIAGSSRLRPAEAAAAAQVEPVMGTLKRYEGPPTFGNKTPDLQIASGKNTGKTVDLMYTTGAGRPAEIEGMNRFFEKNMTASEGPGLPPPGVGQIQEHLNKVSIVIMDFRMLTPRNQQVLQKYIDTLSPTQIARIIFIK